jgi:uncharacterized protein (DUF1810 family)/predicted protein tyrosine phosphatase
MMDPYNLQRFLTAQAEDYECALGELKRGRKESHWIWYIFPQVAGLGHSSMAQEYAIRSRDEAVAYLGHPILGARLQQCCEALRKHQSKKVQDIMGFPDDLKLRSSMTLFAMISAPDSVFHKVLNTFYSGQVDERTVGFLACQVTFKYGNRTHNVHPFKQRLFICGFEERAEYQSRNISHLITIANPGAVASQPSWFKGAHLELRFGDVVSETDARHCKTTAPSLHDLQLAVEFFRPSWVVPGSKILVSCDHGASRSPALAYVLTADQLGEGREVEAFGAVLEIRSVAVPNGLVVRLGDAFLRRNGALLAPLKDFYAKINVELFPKKI